jgi:hypothetical protein
MSMTAYQKVKWLVILCAHEWAKVTPPEITSQNIDELYEQFAEGSCAVSGQMQDSRNEIRASGTRTGLVTPYDRAMRNYEYEEVATQAPDGSWVGWTYWYGGGKHSEPTAIPWMETAYDLNVQEREKVIIERTFTKT